MQIGKEFYVERKVETMNGEERRENILRILSTSDKPVAGVKLAEEFLVSRQVIVQDIALLRANGADIFSTNRGYLIKKDHEFSRVLKVIHTDEEAREELSMIVDLGGMVKDVFVYHKAYGVLKAEMNIKSRMDIKHYMEEISSGKSGLLKNITSGYHYHTILAESEEILDLIQQQFKERGFLAKLQDYEPVNFWEEQENES